LAGESGSSRSRGTGSPIWRCRVLFWFASCEEEVGPCSVSWPKNGFLGYEARGWIKTPSSPSWPTSRSTARSWRFTGVVGAWAMPHPRSWSRASTLRNERTPHRPVWTIERGVSCVATRADQTIAPPGIWAASTPAAARRSRPQSTCRNRYAGRWKISAVAAWTLKTQRWFSARDGGGQSAPDSAGSGKPLKIPRNRHQDRPLGEAHPTTHPVLGSPAEPDQVGRGIAGEGSGKEGIHSRRRNPIARKRDAQLAL